MPGLVQRLLDSYLRGSSDPINCEPERVREVVEWFRSDAEAVLARSHWHTNGFMKHVRIVPEYGRLQFRLHHWPDRNDHSWSSIHNHRADFVSVVVSGQLDEQVYGLEKSVSGATAFTHQLFYYRPHDWARNTGEQVFPSDLANLTIVRSDLLMPGDVRKLPEGQFHRVKADGSCTTLVVRGPALKLNSQIAVPVGESPRLAPRIESITNQQSSSLLRSLIGETSSAPVN